MQEKENLNQFIGSIGIRFPTAQALYDEIGLPLESLAAVFPSSRNDVLNKYGNQVPLEFYRVPGEKAIQAVLNVWEEEIKGYIGIHHS